jgi:hypothetical protein
MVERAISTFTVAGVFPPRFLPGSEEVTPTASIYRCRPSPCSAMYFSVGISFPRHYYISQVLKIKDELNVPRSTRFLLFAFPSTQPSL